MGYRRVAYALLGIGLVVLVLILAGSGGAASQAKDAARGVYIMIAVAHVISLLFLWRSRPRLAAVVMAATGSAVLLLTSQFATVDTDQLMQITGSSFAQNWWVAWIGVAGWCGLIAVLERASAGPEDQIN